MIQHVCRGGGGNEAKIEGPWRVYRTSRPIRSSGWPQIDFLIPEFQGYAPIRSELLSVHAQYVLIPSRHRVEIPAIQDDMVNSVYRERHGSLQQNATRTFCPSIDPSDQEESSMFRVFRWWARLGSN